MILITGGTGFLGPYLIRALSQTGLSLRLLSRDPGKHSHLVSDCVEVVAGDVTDPPSLARALDEVTHVVHAAALLSFWRKKQDAMYAINVEGTRNLLAACARLPVEKFVYVGAMATVGNPVDSSVKVITEETLANVPEPLTTYAKTKALAEQAVIDTACDGIPAVICIPPLIVGAGNWQEGPSALFKMLHDGFKFHMEGSVGTVAARDVAEAVRLLLFGPHRNGERFFLVSAILRNQELFAQIAKSVGKPAPAIRAPKPLLLATGWLLETLANFTGKEPLISRDAVITMTESPVVPLDGSKMTRLYHFTYSPITDAIAETGKQLLQELAMNSTSNKTPSGILHREHP